jgi:hypothetical protein
MTTQNASHESPAFVNLAALLSSVSEHALLSDPALGGLMAECACWEVYLNDWQGRQPTKRSHDYNDWICEGRTLFDRRDELKQLAYALLRPA